MSFEMQRAFYASDLPPTARFVAVTLAWHHNEQTGRCDPSVSLIVSETGLSERAVQIAFRTIEAAGMMTVTRRMGTTPNYKLTPRTTCTPAADAPPHHVHPTPAPRAPKLQRTTSRTGIELQSTPPAAKVEGGQIDSAMQLQSHELRTEEDAHPLQSPVKTPRPKPGPETEACAMTLPGNPSAELAEAWQEWQQYRQRRAIAPGRQRVAWTAQAARLSAKQVTQYAASHGSRIVCDRIASAINGEWQGLNLDKLDNPSAARNKRSDHNHDPNPDSIYGF